MATKAAPEQPVTRPGEIGHEVVDGDTVRDRMLTVYRTVRLPGAVAAGIGNLILTFAFEWPFGWIAVGAATVATIDALRELRSPRSNPAVTIAVDATLIGLTMVAVGLPAVSFAFGLWIVLLTAVLASGWWRPVLYVYVGLWAVVANIVTWSGDREWTQFEVLILDWTALLLVGALVVVLLEVALRRIRQMEAERTYMVGIVGHELGNTLTTVTALAETLERHGSAIGPEESERMISSIRTQARESAEIAEDLVTLAQLRQDGLRIEPELTDAWKETADVVEQAIESTGVPVEVSGQVDSPVVVDPLRLRQVIRNLVINAVDYGAGVLAVDVSVVEGQVRVAVTDQGESIPEDEIELLFQPHSRGSTGSGRRGAGLGLWISKRLAQEMGGDVLYRRDRDTTVFEATFPRAGEADPTV